MPFLQLEWSEITYPALIVVHDWLYLAYHKHLGMRTYALYVLVQQHVGLRVPFSCPEHDTFMHWVFEATPTTDWLTDRTECLTPLAPTQRGVIILYHANYYGTFFFTHAPLCDCSTDRQSTFVNNNWGQNNIGQKRELRIKVRVY